MAVVGLWAKAEGKQTSIIRSREKEIFEKAEMVVDIGGVYDLETNHFDHHQIGGAGKRENGIPYAAIGSSELMLRDFEELADALLKYGLSEEIIIEILTSLYEREIELRKVFLDNPSPS